MTTKSGKNFFEIASLIQKAVRRADYQRAGYCANELIDKYSKAISEGGRSDTIVSSGEDGEGGGVVIYMPQLEELPDEEKEETSESKESPAT